jgi:prepilin-type N-terminal cleavage/methylation domain-containing protein
MRISNQQRLQKDRKGFSLVELLVAMAITLIVLGVTVTMFLKSMDTNDVTLLNTEMQANARAGANALALDISQAGTGVPWGGLTLPSGGGAAVENLGVDPNYVSSTNFYTIPFNAIPAPTGTPAHTVMFGITPINSGGPPIAGPTNNGTATTTMDAINLVYADPIWSSHDPTISNWTTTFAASIQDAGNTVVITMPAGMLPAMNDPNSGLHLGDVVMLTASGGQEAAGTVSAFDPIGLTITLTPGVNDPYNLNQFAPGIASTVRTLETGPGVYPPTQVMRLNVITYYLQGVDANTGAPVTLANAAKTNDFRLIRRINQQPESIVAEHVNYLQFAYDLGDPSCTVTDKLSHIPDAVEPACGGGASSPAYDKIRNVYINLAARSAKPDKRGVYYQTTINTSVAPRSLSYNNIYPADKVQ